MKCPACSYEFKVPGFQKGGRKSRRSLSSVEARAMAKRSHAVQRRKKKAMKPKAFTLIDTLVCVTIACILFALGWLMYETYQSSSVVSGAIVEKRYNAPWTEIQYVKSGNVEIPVSIPHPEEYILVLQGYNKNQELRNRLIRVDATTYHNTAVGSEAKPGDFSKPVPFPLSNRTNPSKPTRPKNRQRKRPCKPRCTLRRD